MKIRSEKMYESMQQVNTSVFEVSLYPFFPSSKKYLLEKITVKVRREGNVFQV